jgi:eukaryotic-like serine/threonine-protein kinase
MSVGRFSPERLELLKSAFEQAVECEPGQRESVLAWLRDQDSEVYEEAMRLAAEYDRAGDFIVPIVPEPIESDAFASTPQFSAGDRISNRYEIVRFIGAGGMGAVYEAEDPNLGRRVALKTVRLDRLRDPKAQNRLRREAVLALQITHPNVCRILDLNWHDIQGAGRVAVLTMVLLEGPTLAEAIKSKGRFAPAEAEPLIRQMIAALGASHAVGVVHRDFKPSNIMLVAGQVVVTDFGLAITKVPSRDHSLTSTGQLVGTPEYMAPEQLRTGEATVQSDIYSLGVVMFEMLTGVRPTQGVTSVDELVRRFVDPAPSPRALNPEISRRCDAVIRRALDPDPARRFRSAQAMEEAFTTNRPVMPEPTRRQTICVVAGAAALSLSTSIYRYWSQRKRIPPGSLCMVTPIQNGTRDARLSAYSSLLRFQLEQSTQIRPWDSARLPEVLARMRRPSSPEAAIEPAVWREIAMREGVPLAVMGSLGQVGEEYVLQIRLERIGSSPNAAAWRRDHSFYASSTTALTEGSREVANWIRAEAGEVAESIAARSRPPAALTTASWDALMLYQQAEETARSEPERSLPFFREAVRLDPEFALAHMRCGDILVTLHRWDEGLPYWESALSAARRQRLSSREEFRLQSFYAMETGDYAGAEAAAMRWTQAYPQDELAKWLVFSSRYTQGRVEEARTALEGLERGTPQGRRLGLFADSQYYLWQADTQRLLRIAAQLADSGETENAARLEGIGHAIGGAFERAKAAFQKIIDRPSPSVSSSGYVLMSVLHSSLGDLDRADAYLEAGSRRDEAAGQRGLRGNKLASRAYLAWIRGSLENSRALALEAAQVTGDPDVQMKAIVVLRRGGFSREAGGLARWLDLPEKYPRFRACRMLLDGETLVAQSKASEAVPKIADALRYRSASLPPEPLLYALWNAGDLGSCLQLVARVRQRPYYAWSSPEQQLGPITLLINKLKLNS